MKYKRAVVPHDAVSLEMTTLEFGDASQILICVAIYVRFLRKCGKYSCQLLLAKSRLVPEGMTQPRAEFFAAVSNTHCGEVVKRALKKNHQKNVLEKLEEDEKLRPLKYVKLFLTGSLT